MKCNNCGKNNPEDSLYCENCGDKIKHLVKKHKDLERFERISEEISDVLFTPKKSNTGTYTAWVIVAILVVLIVGLMYWVMIGRYNQSNFQGSSGFESPTPTIDYSQPGTFPISYLSIEKTSLEWQGQNLFYNGVLKNTYSMPAKNIKIRIDLYYDQEAKDLFDTRYIMVTGVAAEGAFTFSEQVFAYPTKRFWSVATITSADFYQ